MSLLSAPTDEQWNLAPLSPARNANISEDANKQSEPASTPPMTAAAYLTDGSNQPQPATRLKGGCNVRYTRRGFPILTTYEYSRHF